MYLGLDLGTSGMRGVLVDDGGNVLHSAESGYPVSHPHPGWSEQSPQDWTRACVIVLNTLAERAPREMGQVRALAVSGQMHGATLLDIRDQVLRPCILWNDTRSAKEAAALDAAPDMRAISGNIVFPGFTAPKLAWVARHEPETYSRVAKVLLPKDYLNFWLTGVHASDMSDAAGTAWLDVGARDWSDRLLRAGGMRRDQMPDLYEGVDVVGQLRADRAAELGLPAGVAVVAGGADNAVAACGVGALGEGDAFVSLGTSGVLLAGRDSFAPDPGSAVHTFCHAVPEKWYQMGVILAATDSLNWLARITGADPSALTDALGDRVLAPGALRFMPYLSGERTPHNDSLVRGAFLGLDIAHEREDLTRAVLEGVSFALRDSLHALRGCGARIDRALAIGGGTRSRYWTELLATILDLPLDVPVQGDFGAALGAARLAICGATGADPAEVMTKPAIARTIDPRADLRALCDDAYRAHVETFPTLKAMP